MTACIASDAAKLLPQQQVQEMFQDCFATPAPAEPSNAVKHSKLNKGKHKLAGHDVLFEFACDKESNLGTVGAEHGIKVIRLCKEDIDLECPESIEQLIAQVKGLQGCSIHCSIECKPWSQWQRLNEHKYPRLSASIRKERKNSEDLLKQFIRVANVCLDNGGDCSFEWPRFCSGWALPCLQEWILDRQLHSAVFNGCTVGVEADGQPAKKPWRFVTSSKRLASSLSSLVCQHKSHAPLEGKWTRRSAFYPRPLCNIMINSLFPDLVNQHVFSMPVEAKTIQNHRPKLVPGNPCMPIDVIMYEVGCKQLTTHALVHRLLDRREWKGRPEVNAAIEAEKNGLLEGGTWKESEIMSKADVLKKYSGSTIHFGSLMVIVSIKGFEKQPDEWKIKARVVFRGDAVRDQDGLAATFQELQASAPSSIAGLNVVMAYSMIGDNICTTSDCIRAYIQCLLKSKHPTFVLLPPELVPPHLKHIIQPCALLHKALYGHPESSAHWSLHLAEVLKVKMGGKEFPNMPSIWWFESSKMIMSVYVDDLTLGGNKTSHPSFWKELQQYINLDPFTEFGRVLGRDHQVLNGELVLGSSDFTRQCISLYLELSGKKIKVAPTPHLEEGSLLPDDDTVKGQLLPVAARLVMKLMWLCRTSRPDITFAVNLLAKHITIWTANDDKRAARLIGYLSSTVDLAHFMVINDRLEDLHLALYCDADFAGDNKTMKSTSGFVMALEGKSSFALLSWGSRKQSVISRSTTESEFVSLSGALFAEGLPLLELWQVIHPPMILRILEDNSAVIAIIAKGFSQKLRHLAKTHRVNVASTCEAVNDNDDVLVQHVPTEDQRSDIMTKGLAPQKWAHALMLLNMKFIT